MTIKSADSGPAPGGYRHEALIYAGIDDFVPTALDFISAGLRADAQILVVTDEEKIDALETELGRDEHRVSFADMTDVGSNPARLIGLWHEFLGEHASAGPIRGIGEPIYARRSASELVECQLHESLLNLAFTPADDFWLLCPSTSSPLPMRSWRKRSAAIPTSPMAASADRRSLSPTRRADLFNDDLGPVPPDAVRFEFGPAELSRLRRLVVDQATQARFHSAQAGEVEMAINELATNAVEHGGGRGVAQVWIDNDVIFVEIADGGRFGRPLAGRIPPSPAQVDGRGLWIANQLCDLIRIRRSPTGTVVRAQVRRIGSA